MQRAKGNSTNSIPASKLSKDPSTSEVENETVVDVQENEGKAERTEDKGTNTEGVTEEGIKSVINFLKEKIPGLKVKVMNVDATEEVIKDIDSMKQLMQEGNEKAGSTESSEDGVSNLDEIQPDGVTLGGGSEASEDEKDLDMKLFIGGVVHNNDDTPTKDEFVRLPAEIKDMERDSFVLHIPGRSLDYHTGESKVSRVKVAALAAQGVSELMPSDVAKAFWSADKVSSKVRLRFSKWILCLLNTLLFTKDTRLKHNRILISIYLLLINIEKTFSLDDFLDYLVSVVFE